MIITHEREKLIQAINFFAQRTCKLGKTKLFKLLHFLDFEHFKATGRSVTGLRYFAWPMGPVPVDLFNEIDSPEPDLAASVSFDEIPVRSGSMLSVRAKEHFSPRLFSKREMALMEWLAREHRDADADSMVEATHLENSPWHKIYVDQGRQQQEIPYDLAVRPDEKVLIKSVAADREDVLSRLS